MLVKQFGGLLAARMAGSKQLDTSWQESALPARGQAANCTCLKLPVEGKTEEPQFVILLFATFRGKDSKASAFLCSLSSFCRLQ